MNLVLNAAALHEVFHVAVKAPPLDFTELAVEEPQELLSLTLTSPRSYNTRDIIVVFRFAACSWLAVRCASCSRDLTRPNPRLFDAADCRAEGAARSSKHVLEVC